jgi:hypothetical protein
LNAKPSVEEQISDAQSEPTAEPGQALGIQLNKFQKPQLATGMQDEDVSMADTSPLDGEATVNGVQSQDSASEKPTEAPPPAAES